MSLGSLRRNALLGLVVLVAACSADKAPEPTPVTAADLLPRFRLEAVPTRPFVVTPQLLRSIGFSP